MSRARRIILWVVGGLVGLIALVVIAALIVVQTQWFRDYVRTKIVSYAEEATGGKVDIESFSFDWTHLHARLTGFVLHGLEPPNVPPLFSARTIDVDLKLLPSLSHIVQLQYLGVDQPEVDVIVYPDGHTNVPAPKTKPTSNTTVLEDVVNLAIRKFDMENGSITFAQRKSDFSAHGENLRAQLSYNIASAAYDGQLSMAPLYVKQDGRPPLDVNVALPLHLERDKVQLTNARIATGESQIVVTGEMDRLADPHESAHLNATISLADVKQVAGAALPVAIPPNGPRVLNAEADFSMDKDHIVVKSARVSLGQSDIEASGKLKDPAGNGAVQFKASLTLAELAQFYKNPYNPRGVIALKGNAKLVGANNDYFVDGNIEAKNLSFTEDGTRVQNVNLASAIDVNKQAIELKGLRLAAFGGTFDGNAGVENMERFHVDGRLGHFDTAEMARLFAHENIGYDGIVSGPVEATGDLKAPSKLAANVHLTIAPGPRGVPITGQVNANYNGATGSIDVARSYLALPHSRLDLSGAVNRELKVNLVSRDLNDFLPAMQMGSKNPPKEMPIALESGGSADFSGVVTGKLSAPHLAGHIAVTRFEAQQRPFNSLIADLSASPSGVSVQNGALTSGGTSGALQAHFNAAVGLKNWSAPPTAPLTVNATVANAGLADVMALAGENAKEFSGTLNANARIDGTIGNPRGAATLTVDNLTAYGEHFDQLAGQVNFSDRLIAIPDLRLSAGQNRIDLTAAYQHAPDSLESGRLHVTLASNTMQLAQFEAVKKGTPELTGTAQINADINARIDQVDKQTEFLVTSANATAAAHGLKFEGTAYGDLNATARTSGDLVSYNVASDFAGSNIHATGQTRLVRDYPTTANLNIGNLRIERVLAVVGHRDVPLTGVLSTTARLSGTLNDPRADADIRIANANYYEHFDSIQGHIDYSKQLIGIPSLEIASGAARAQLAASFAPQPPGQFAAGKLTFKLNTNQIQIAQFKTVQNDRPGLAGVAQVNAEGAATLDNAPGKPAVLFSNLNADASIAELALNKKPLGDARLTATTSGTDLAFNLDSNIAGSKIHGDGHATLTGDYPVTSALSFSNVRYANVRDLLGTNTSLEQASYDVLVEWRRARYPVRSRRRTS